METKNRENKAENERHEDEEYEQFKILHDGSCLVSTHDLFLLTRNVSHQIKLRPESFQKALRFEDLEFDDCRDLFNVDFGTWRDGCVVNAYVTNYLKSEKQKHQVFHHTLEEDRQNQLNHCKGHHSVLSCFSLSFQLLLIHTLRQLFGHWCHNRQLFF